MFGPLAITLLSFDLWRNCYIKNVVLFEENSILLPSERLEASGVESVWGEVSQASPKNPDKSVKIDKLKVPIRSLVSVGFPLINCGSIIVIQ